MKKLIYSCLFCLSAGIAAFGEPGMRIDQQPEVSEEQSWVEKGMKAVQANHLQEALKDFRQAKKVNPQFAPAYVGEAQALTVQNAWDEALVLLNRAIEIAPEFGIAYHNRGVLKYYKKQYLEAHADLRKAIQLGETVEQDLLFQVWGAAFPDDAARLMSDQIKAHPKEGEAYLNRGIAYFYQKKYQLALDDWKKAKELGLSVDPEMQLEVETAIQSADGAKHAVR